MTQTRLKGIEAIQFADTNDLLLCKFADPTEDAREDLTVDEARKVVEEDPSLVYIDVPLGVSAVLPATKTCQ